MDLKLLDVLSKANCLEYYQHFAALTKDELTDMGGNDLKIKLADVLQPVITNRRQICEKIMAEILRYDPNDDNDDTLPVPRLDLEILRVLSKCNSLKNYTYFVGHTKEDLTKVPIKQLNPKLRHILPVEPDRENFIQNLLIELFKNDDAAEEEQHQQVDSTDSQENPEAGLLQIKVEKHIEETEKGSSAHTNDDDDDVRIVCAKLSSDKRDIPIVSLVDEDVIIDEKDESEINMDEDISISPGQHNPSSPKDEMMLYLEGESHDVTSVTTKSLKRKKTPTETSASTSRRRTPRVLKTRQKIGMGPVSLRPSEALIELLDKNDAPRHVELRGDCKRQYLWKKWKRLFSRVGSDIDRLDCIHWTWKSVQARCPFNLVYILSKVCPQLKQLSILSECNTKPEVLVFPRLNLDKLTHLKIDHNGLLKYHDQLAEIIIATNGNLERIEFAYQDEVALNRFLNILEAMEPNILAKLKYLSIQHRDGEHVALLDTEVTTLGNIKAAKLEELDLGFGFWGDTKAALEALLNNFCTLKKLKDHGSFITTDKEEPKLIINFPRMPHLEILDLGGNYEFVSVIESINERPAKRKSKKTSNINFEQGRHPPTPAKLLSSQEEDQEEDILGQYFSVTLNLPELPKLKSLILGSCYDLSDLHFARMPLLEVFRVASPWHLIVSFPSAESRHNAYSKLKELQLPDFFQDFSFIPKIARYFPSIEKCYINLPTVKVIRAFAKVMGGVESFKHFELKTRFDFESSLNSCFLKNPWLEPQSRLEMDQVRILKEYTFWKEYAQLNNIDVPDFDIQEEDEATFAGLHEFRDKLETFNITHVARKLRLPKGHLHWNHDNCEFTTTLIGYGENEYPFTQYAFENMPELGTFKSFDMGIIKSKKLDKFSFKKPKFSCQLDDSIISLESKKEEISSTSLSSMIHVLQLRRLNDTISTIDNCIQLC
ncbi:hypothetical protein Fcan01_06419 [Folsomia candida]|uniref:Uncharacterized protein n=1 Tax=Folsomia candida TaxID=158441 RepID=A0A226EKH3_FOLCA|nr:hypothetical protein Fcan01_06419 [Folsomia candida]